MTDPKSSRQWPDLINAEEDGLLLRFDLAWQEKAPPELKAFCLPDASLPFLKELILVDMHRRFSRGIGRELESYLQLFPGQVFDDEALFDLVCEEIQCRRTWGATANLDDFLRRFPRFKDRLSALQESEQVPQNLNLPLRDSSLEIARPGSPTGPPEKAGQEGRIGPYKLLQKLGEGGMGAVWVAEQTEPVKRRVALKLIKPGMDSEQVIRRFEAERQILALMDHTNIAKVFDAGTTPEGRPYFVMELVKGVPFTKYCDELHLSVRERLALFIPVCRAIQHAHTKGIIHRDIKPSNVMVCMQDNVPVPKVIDFGVAKALHQRLTEGSMYTEIGAVIGTLEYMSPEQAELSALDVDTRTDVYALGVMLYELLTGTTPLERRRLRNAVMSEALRMICQEEPPKPSTRLTNSKESIASLAAHRRTEPAKLKKEIRGELDWITMKCLEKDRTRRYETANGLARDIERFMQEEPVEACPPSATYQTRKFLRKHRTAVRTAVACALVLLAGVVVSSWQAVRATRAESTARANEFLAQNGLDAARKANEALAEASEEVRKERNTAQEARARAEEQLERVRRLQFSSQLQEVASIWQTNPYRALELLTDDERCPPHLRDFTWGFYLQLCKRSPRLMDGQHSIGWNSLAFSPDGKILASADKIGQIKIWDVKKGKSLHTLEGSPGINQLLAFSTEGATLAAMEAKGKIIHRWHVASGLALAPIPATGFVKCLAFSPDGKTLCWGTNNQVVFYDTASEKTRELKSGNPLGIFSLAFSRDGKKLATGHGKFTLPEAPALPGEITVWDLETEKEIANGKGHTNRVTSLAFSADGKTVTSVGLEGNVKTWDAQNGKEIATISRWENVINSTAITPMGHVAALGSMGYFQLVDFKNRKELKIDLRRAGYSGPVALSPDGDKWATIMPGMKVGVWENLVMESATLTGHTGTVYGVSFSQDGRLLATCSGESTNLFQTGEVKIWDVESAKELANLDSQLAGFYSVKFSPGGQTVAAASALGEVKLWDLKTHKLKDTLRGHVGWVRCLAFSPDRQSVVSAGADRSIRLWDVASGKQRANFLGHTGVVNSIAFSSDGKFLVSCSSDPGKKRIPGEVKLWDVNTATELADFKGHKDSVFCVAFSPDDKTVVSVAFDRQAILWDVPTRKLRTLLGGNSEFGKAAVFSSDGKTLAIGSAGKESDGKNWGIVRLWDPVLGQLRASIPAQAGILAALAFDPENKILATASTNGTVKLWTSSPR